MEKCINSIKALILDFLYRSRKRGMFESVEDIKKFMLFLSKIPVEDIKISEECEWFSKVRYTTLSEYVGELKFFVDDLRNRKEFSSYAFQLAELRKVLVKLFAQY